MSLALSFRRTSFPGTSVPIYDYKCDKCRAEFQKSESIAAHGRKAVSCPKCKSTNVSQVITAPYVKAVKKS